MPAARRQVRLTVAPVNPPPPPKRAASKGKVVPRPMMWPHAHKVTRLASPTPEVAGVKVPPLPIAGPSGTGNAPLFTESVGLGDAPVRKEVPASSGE